MKSCYGITHDVNGKPRVLEPKTTKVGIGLPKGKAIHVFIDPQKKWVIVVGKDVAGRFDSKLEAKKFYRKAKADAPERKYPQRLPFFTFSRVSPDGSFEPDWDAMESHGSMPAEIDIIFVKDDSFSASYQMWTALEKKCDGDGINAMRILSLASTPEEKQLAAQVAQKGEKYFPIKNGCWTRGCPYSKPQGDKPAQCRPHGRLLFQLLNAPRLGGTAYFDTSGFRSISQLFSCIQTFRSVTGRGDPDKGFIAGIPIKMVLRPYKTQYNGRSVTQYGVSLEFRAENVLDLKKQLIEHGVQFRLAETEPLKQLEGALEIEARPPEESGEPEEIPAAIHAEFSGPGPGGVDYGDAVMPESGIPGAPDLTTQLGSEIQKQPPPNPEDEEIPEQSPEFEALWDDPAAANSQSQTEPASAAKVKELGEQAKQNSAPSNIPAGQLPLTDIPANKANSKQQRGAQFYDFCRSQGMTDQIIMKQLGIMGFERLGEITDEAYPALWKWAKEYKAPGA